VVYLTVYVDELLVVGKMEGITVMIADLAKKFKLKDLGRVHNFLGMEVNYKPGALICMSQKVYIEQPAEKFGLASARPVHSPQMHNEPTLPIEQDEDKINNPALPYREIVGSLQYLVACTRPDMANVVRTLGRNAGAYTRQNYEQAKRAVRYVLATKNLGLVFRMDKCFEETSLEVFADAVHARCPETSRSVSGYVLETEWVRFRLGQQAAALGDDEHL
jgi:hypothetical protein